MGEHESRGAGAGAARDAFQRDVCSQLETFMAPGAAPLQRFWCRPATMLERHIVHEAAELRGLVSVTLALGGGADAECRPVICYRPGCEPSESETALLQFGECGEHDATAETDAATKVAADVPTTAQDATRGAERGSASAAPQPPRSCRAACRAWQRRWTCIFTAAPPRSATCTRCWRAARTPTTGVVHRTAARRLSQQRFMGSRARRNGCCARAPTAASATQRATPPLPSRRRADTAPSRPCWCRRSGSKRASRSKRGGGGLTGRRRRRRSSKGTQRSQSSTSGSKAFARGVRSTAARGPRARQNPSHGARPRRSVWLRPHHGGWAAGISSGPSLATVAGAGYVGAKKRDRRSVEEIQLAMRAQGAKRTSRLTSESVHDIDDVCSSEIGGGYDLSGVDSIDAYVVLRFTLFTQSASFVIRHTHSTCTNCE